MTKANLNRLRKGQHRKIYIARVKCLAQVHSTTTQVTDRSFWYTTRLPLGHCAITNKVTKTASKDWVGAEFDHTYLEIASEVFEQFNAASFVKHTASIWPDTFGF